MEEDPSQRKKKGLICFCDDKARVNEEISGKLSAPDVAHQSLYIV